VRNAALPALSGVATTALLHLGPPPETSASAAGVTVSCTTKQQFNVVAPGNIFGPRSSRSSRTTWSTGSSGCIRSCFGRSAELAGIGYHLNDYFGIVDPKAEQSLPSPMVRGENQIYLEEEYRVTLSPDGSWGAAAFVNLWSTSDATTGSFKKVDSGAGLGLRIKLNKRSTTNITVHYAVGQEGSNGLFLGTGEAF
jgi:hypothetical protein